MQIHFADGTIHSGTYEEVLRKLAKDRLVSGYDIRKDLAKRAWVWSGTPVDSELALPEFFAQLELAGLCKVKTAPLLCGPQGQNLID